MSFDKFYNDLKSRNKNKKGKQELHNLHIKPKRENDDEAPHAQIFEPNVIHQADLLFLPNDKGYRYALVVVDLHNKKTDAQPLKTKDSLEVREAFKKIYARTYLDIPFQIEVDDGNEFKGDVKKYFDQENVRVRVAPPGRHRSQAFVERKNQEIGTILLKRMTAQELLTGERNNEWTEDLPKLIALMNKHTKAVKTEISKTPIVTKRNRNLLSIGDKVRLVLDNPKDIIEGRRLHGKFRSSDVRWDTKIRTVKEIILKPGYPPLYLLDGNQTKRNLDITARTRQQLQLVSEHEEAPDPSVIRGKPTRYIVKSILDHKTMKKKKYLLVQWKG